MKLFLNTFLKISIKIMNKLCMFSSLLLSCNRCGLHGLVCVCVCKMEIFFSRFIESFHLLQRTLKKCMFFFPIFKWEWIRMVALSGAIFYDGCRGHCQNWNGSKWPGLAIAGKLRCGRGRMCLGLCSITNEPEEFSKWQKPSKLVSFCV